MHLPILKKCYKCFRPIKSCYCSIIRSISTGIKFLILIHPHEAYKEKTGTGRLVHLSLDDSELLVGVDFTNHPRVNSLITDPAFFPMLLYPGIKAHPVLEPGLKNIIGERIPLIIIIDATWAMSRKIKHLSQNLHALAQISFTNRYVSQFQIKKQPKPHFLSTIESAYYLLGEFKEAGIVDPLLDTTPLITLFKTMVEYQKGFFK